MSESLIVRLSNNRHVSKQWLVWSDSLQQVIASGELSAEQSLSELEQYAEQRRTYVLLNSADVLLKQVTIPAGGARQFDSMLPYLLEDDVAQDVDELHFSVLAKQGDQAFVAGVDKAWLTHQLEQLAQVGCQVVKVMPDAFALPQSEGISAVEIDGYWLLKKSNHQALAIESEWLPMVAKSNWVKQEETWLPLEAYSALPELELAAEQHWQQVQPQLVMQLLAVGALSSNITLLTGEFKPKSSLLKHLKVWRQAAIAASILLVVLLAQYFVQAQQAEQQANAYRAESERIFRSVMAKSKIPTTSYLKREMDNELKRLSSGNSENSMLTWLVKLPLAVKNIANFEVTELTFDEQRGELKFEARSKNFQAFEQARTQLEQQFVVEQGQLTKSNNYVVGSFVLKQ